jgi:hypothetical protein
VTPRPACRQSSPGYTAIARALDLRFEFSPQCGRHTLCLFHRFNFYVLLFAQYGRVGITKMFKTDHNHRDDGAQLLRLEFTRPDKPALHVHKESSNSGLRDGGLNQRSWSPTPHPRISTPSRKSPTQPKRRSFWTAIQPRGHSYMG